MTQPLPNYVLSTRGEFPRLQPSNHVVTSPVDRNYNCIAWAAGDTGNWWEPDVFCQLYWPPEVPREYSLAAYAAAYATLGYRECGLDKRLQAKWEKVAIYADSSGVPTHAARQLPNGMWASKLGKGYDIEHHNDTVGGGLYGEVKLILRRPRGGFGQSRFGTLRKVAFMRFQRCVNDFAVRLRNVFR
jgi:hypothetical protein